MGQNDVGYVEQICMTACTTYADQISEDPAKYGKFNSKDVAIWTDVVRHQKVTEISYANNRMLVAIFSAVVVYAIALVLIAAALPEVLCSIALAASVIPLGFALYHYIVRWGLGNEFVAQAVREAQEFLRSGPINTWINPRFRDSYSHDPEAFNQAGRATGIQSMQNWHDARMKVFAEAKAKPNFVNIVRALYQGRINDRDCTAFCTAMFEHDPEMQLIRKSLQERMDKFQNSLNTAESVT